MKTRIICLGRFGWLTSALAIVAFQRLDVAASQGFDVWIGTTERPATTSKGIYHCRFDAEEGRLTQPQVAAEIESPGFLALHPNGKVLYSTGRQNGVDSLSAYRIEQSGKHAELSLINAQSTDDGTAAHLATDRNGRLLLSAQYGESSVAVFPLAGDGRIGHRTQLVKHRGGSKVVADRQAEPHPHWVGTSPDNRFAFVPDLGMDRVIVYEMDEVTGHISPHGQGVVPAGAGPRHMKFHPRGDFIYLLNELELSISVFAYDRQKGTMSIVQTIPTLATTQKARERFVSGSEIRVHPTGKFVYAANRGHDSITVFRTLEDGRLELVEVEPIRGSWPRNFNIDPTGKWLLAAGRDSNTLAVFHIDEKTGELIYTLHTISVPNPICVLFSER